MCSRSQPRPAALDLAERRHVRVGEARLCVNTRRGRHAIAWLRPPTANFEEGHKMGVTINRASVTRPARTTLALAALAVPVAVHGGTATGAPAAPACAAAAHVVNIAANPGALLKYTRNAIGVAAEMVTICFTNTSPDRHNVVVVNFNKTTLGTTSVLMGGTGSFTVKLTAGKDIHYCSVPGHRAAGMQGTLTVT
jgi:uncharacterized cupredoxin-like copper-binding protein